MTALSLRVDSLEGLQGLQFRIICQAHLNDKMQAQGVKREPPPEHCISACVTHGPFNVPHEPQDHLGPAANASKTSRVHWVPKEVGNDLLRD